MMLAEGGNAIEAMVAMAATHRGRLSAHEPYRRRRLLADPRAVRTRAGLDGGGLRRQPATPELYARAGYDVIPSRGPLAALTVPGAIAGWRLALEASRAQRGRLPLDALLAPRCATPATVFRSRPARPSARPARGRLKDVPGFAQAFLVDGKPPAAGTMLRQPALADTLEQLAHAGLDDFYRGDVGREIAADLERLGSPVTRADLERCRAARAEPLSVAIGAGTFTTRRRRPRASRR